MNDDVKRQIGVLIEQSGSAKERATLLVMLNMADCLASTSQVIADLTTKVESIGTQLAVNSERRSMMVRAIDKAMPYLIAAFTGICGWAYSQINGLHDEVISMQTWRAEHVQYHKDKDR